MTAVVKKIAEALEESHLEIDPMEASLLWFIAMYKAELLTIGQAASLYGVSRVRFQEILASRNIPINYDIEEAQEDLNTLLASGHHS